MKSHSRKVAIIGIGKVGITTAYAMLLRGTVDELILVSRTLEKAVGEKLDLEHGLPFLEKIKITATTNYSALEDADVVIITAGAPQKPGQTRLELIQENKLVIEELAKNMKPYVRNSVVIVVSNPVDILTFQLAKLLDLPYGRVLGTGTMLDTARFRFILSEMLDVNPRSIHTYILGEHGDSSFPVLEHATVGGQKLELFPNYTLEKAYQAFIQTKEAAAKIIESKGATYYAIGVVVSQLVHTILQDMHSVLPISTQISEYYGQSGVSISVPCIIGRNGVERVLTVELSEKEKKQFVQSCEVLRTHM